MNDTQIRIAKSEALAFIARAETVLLERREDPTAAIVGTRASGSLRRQSMELTRALAALRRP